MFKIPYIVRGCALIAEPHWAPLNSQHGSRKRSINEALIKKLLKYKKLLCGTHVAELHGYPVSRDFKTWNCLCVVFV
jgi:hypothetical protein